MEEPGFWDDPDRSTKLMKEAKNLKDTVNGFKALEQEYEDISVMIEMGYEENDPELIPEIAQMLEELESSWNPFGLPPYYPVNMTIIMPFSV